MHIIPTILCGGAGSRLWPISRELHPKPFIRLEDGKSLLQKAFLRGAGLPDITEVLTVTNRELFFKIEDEYQELKHNLKTCFILEPEGKNTAAAVIAACLHTQKNIDPNSLLLILAADHLIGDQENFQQSVFEAAKYAQQGKLVTFGIKPTQPNTGYGYIEAKNNHVLRFIEKPDFYRAQEYINAGNFFWNSGMFLFKTETLLEEAEKYCPNILEKAQACIQLSRIAQGQNFSQLELDAKSFSKVPENSIDYAVMEKSQNIAVVPCDFQWSDIGCWNAFENLVKSDAKGNCIVGEAVVHQVQNCYIQSQGRVIGALGIENLIVVDTEDALLIADKKCSQDVKKIYNKLKEKNHEAHKTHLTVYRPWGTYTVLEEGKHFKIKRIKVKPKSSLSLQMHQHRSEHWIVVEGTAKVTNGEEEFIINTNQSTYIPAGNKHRLENPETNDLVIIEVQSGDYLGEDDIIRFEDHYGRV